MLLSLSVDFFFSKLNFSKNSFRNTTRVSNCLDPYQDQQNVGPDLGPNCLQRLSADDKNLPLERKVVQINKKKLHKIEMIFLSFSLNISFGCSKEPSY